MSLSVATLAGFPAVNTTLQRSAGSPTDAITHAYTNGVYTPTPGAVWVAGILDQQGVNPSRIFHADVGASGGSGGSGSTIALPTLISVTQVSAVGSSLQEMPTNYTTANSGFIESSNATGYAGFVVLLSAATGQMDDGMYPLGYDNATLVNSDVPGWTSQGGAYTNASITVGYPNPQMRFYVTMNALLIIASTSTG